HLRLREDEREHVLQLISEAKRAARLIERRAPPHAAPERLVEEPAIQHQIHRRLRRAHLDRSEQLVPEQPRALGRVGGNSYVAIALDDLAHAIDVARFAKLSDDSAFLAGFERELYPHGAARIER